MRRLLACTCLTPLAVAALSSVHAETVISTKITTPVITGTANNGAADDVRISSTGGVAPTGGAAVTINSNNTVRNEGAITITGANGATGILANPNVTSTITNTGTIVIDESFTPTDSDSDGDLDGAFAQGSNRFGIRLAPGGTFTGNIVSGGTITIEGNDSAGIAADSRLAGALNNSATIDVLGNNSFGIRAAEVTGGVQLNGAIAVRGANAIAAALDGNIGGALIVQGALISTGYRTSVPPTDTSKLDADDLLQGGSALRIRGNVAGGILLAAPPPNLDPNDADEDDDGTPDANEVTGSVTTYGAAPAIEIGSATQAINVGAVAGNANGHGLVINGNVTGLGAYGGIAANGIRIGGLGSNVTIAGGMTVTGAVRAESNGASATALRIGNGATVNEIRVSGIVSAIGGGTASSLTRGIQIDEQAVVTSIRNSGTIGARSAGADGSAAAILDNSGRVALVENSGKILATGAAAGSDRNVAIDLSRNNNGAIVRQTVVGQGVASPEISGNILFGSGDDLLEVADGVVVGTTRFGAGANRLVLGGDATYSGAFQFGAGNDRLTMSGTSIFTGNADFGGGTDLLELSGTARFGGTLANSAGLSVTMNGGTLAVGNGGTVALASLGTAGASTLGVNIDAAANTNTLYQVAGAANIGAGTKVQVRLANVSESEGSYTFLRAGTLTGGANLSFDPTNLPFLFKGSLTTNAAGNEAAVVINRRTATELGLNRSESAAYDSIFAVLDEDEAVADVYLGLTGAEGFRATLRQMLPDHAGGAFDTVTQGSRATARFLGDVRGPFADHGRWGYWLQQVAYGSSKDLGDTAAYDIGGWGVAGGMELIGGDAGNFGVSLGYIKGEDEDGDTDNEVRSEQFELGAYWRGQWGGLRAWGRLSAAWIGFESQRNFIGGVGGDTVTRTARGDWNGQLYSAAAGLSYEINAGRFVLRPAASIDYYRLSEGGYSESGGGEAFDLIVDSRTSDEFAGTATLTAGYELGDRAGGSSWMRAELEGGRRQILGGALGPTTARFGAGDPFTLDPEERSDGWVGRLRLIGGSPGFTVGGEASAEEQFGKAGVAFRISLQLGM